VLPITPSGLRSTAHHYGRNTGRRSRPCGKHSKKCPAQFVELTYATPLWPKRHRKTARRFPAYDEWLASSYYTKVSGNLPREIKQKNMDLIATLVNIPLMPRVKNRK